MNVSNLLYRLDHFFGLEDLSLEFLLEADQKAIDTSEYTKQDVYSESGTYHDVMDIQYYLHDRLIPHSDIEIHWRYKNDNICFGCFCSFSYIISRPYFCEYFRAYFCHDCISEKKGVFLLDQCHRIVADPPSIKVLTANRISKMAYDYIQAHQFDNFILLSHWMPKYTAKVPKASLYHKNLDKSFFFVIQSRIYQLIEKLDHVIRLCKYQGLNHLQTLNSSILTSFQKLR